MTCQTGIRADAELKRFFEECRREKVRLAKFVINKEKITVNHRAPPTAKWEDDWIANLPRCVDSCEPCFILFHFDSARDWALISFADDKAPTRDKMLLAATKATFKQEFGASYIRHDIQISTPGDLELERFRKRLGGGVVSTATSDSNTPYTHIERELSTVSRDKIAMPTPTRAAAASPLRVAFPVDRDALDRLRALADGSYDFVQLSVDTLNEAIKLESTHERLPVDSLSNNISRDKPRYTIYRLRDAESEPVLPPSIKCSIKELMLYSSCKATFAGELSTCGIRVTKSIEVDAREKLDAPSLLAYVSPSKAATGMPTAATAYSRPQRPGRPSAGGIVTAAASSN